MNKNKSEYSVMGCLRLARTSFGRQERNRRLRGFESLFVCRHPSFLAIWASQNNREAISRNDLVKGIAKELRKEGKTA
jgi:hypothetical protein